MQVNLVHSIHGRVRLRLPELRKAADQLWRSLSHWVGGQTHVLEQRMNPACACVIVYYETGSGDALEQIVAGLEALSISELAALIVPAIEPRPPVPSRLGTVLLQFVNAVSLLTRLSEPKAFAVSSISLALTIVPVPFIMVLALPAIFVTAWPSLQRAFTVLWRERRLNVDFLDSLAIIVSLARTQFFTAAFMIWMITMGDLIRNKTASKSKRAIRDLLEFQTTQAWVFVNGELRRVPAIEVLVGDTVVVHPGEMIPVDGEVLKGEAAVDQKIVTGESLPIERRQGDVVYASTVVREGEIVLRALRVGQDTTAAQIVHLVEEAPVGETRIQNYAERFADRLVAPSLALSGGLFALTGDANRLLSMLIIDYGTGIRVAAPTTVLASMTHAARQGILIKSGSHMEKLAHLDTIVFDKTGTLTHGRPEILDIVSLDERSFPARKILQLAAASEERLKHPVAKALVAKALTEHIKIPQRIESEFRIGLGVEARVNGYFIHIGNGRYFRSKDIRYGKSTQRVSHFNDKGWSTLLFAVNGELKGLIPYADEVRPEGRDIIRILHKRGIRNTVMLTGDNANVAAAVAGHLGIDRVFAETMPSDKADIVRQLQAEGHVVGMVGDGINDSPALAYADVGIAMLEGADVARETADVVLMEDNLWKLITAIDISRNAMRLIHQNYAIIAGLNTLALALAIPQGLIRPDMSALLSNGSAILASLNAIRPILEY